MVERVAPRALPSAARKICRPTPKRARSDAFHRDCPPFDRDRGYFSPSTALITSAAWVSVVVFSVMFQTILPPFTRNEVRL